MRNVTRASPGRFAVISMMSLRAAGKSTLLSQRYGGNPKYTVIDPDVVSGRLPGPYPKVPRKVHRKASKIAEGRFQAAVRDAASPGTGDRWNQGRHYLL